jgi:hypothetical protein
MLRGRRGCGLEVRDDDPRFAPLRDGIVALANLSAQCDRGFARFGKWHVQRRSQTIIAPPPVALHSQHPVPRPARLHDQTQTTAIDMATGLCILHFQSRQRH